MQVISSSSPNTSKDHLVHLKWKKNYNWTNWFASKSSVFDWLRQHLCMLLLNITKYGVNVKFKEVEVDEASWEETEHHRWRIRGWNLPLRWLTCQHLPVQTTCFDGASLGRRPCCRAGGSGAACTGPNLRQSCSCKTQTKAHQTRSPIKQM